MSWGPVFVVCVLSTAACLKEPKFNGTDMPRDADGDAPDADTMGAEPTVTANIVGGIPTIDSQHFHITFANTGSHFPTSLTIDGMEMLGQAQACNAERRIGYAVFPSLLINDEDQAGSPAQMAPTVTLPGPLVAQVRLPFNYTITCNGADTAAFSGFTTFTAFPDGRVTRHDDIDVTGSMSSTMCPTCTGGTGTTPLYLTTYAVLHANTGDSVYPTNVSTLNPGMEAQVAETAFCADYNNRQISVAFFTSGSDAGNRIRDVTNGGDRNLAFVHDVVRAAGTIDGAASREMSTTMLLGQNGSCMAGYTRAQAFRARPQIRLTSNGNLTLPLGVNGIYSSASYEAIGHPVGPITFEPVSTAIPGGYAIWLELGAQQPVTSVTVTHSRPAMMTPNWYRLQMTSQDQLIIYFKNPLAPGDIITITPPPPA